MDPNSLTYAILGAIRPLIQGDVSADELTVETVALERPRNRDHGDWATSIALKLSKRLGVRPRELAASFAEVMEAISGVGTVEIAGPGFINIWMDMAVAGETARLIVENWCHLWHQ